jgi:hypothetical protein
MPSIPPFNLPGQWYKGSLHTHTTNSDGRLTPEENVAWHTSHGYDFLTITDHNRVTLLEQDGPCLVIPGVEISTRREATGVEYHIVTIGVREMPIPKMNDPQDTIDAVNNAGGLCFVAHPYWHDHTLDDLLPLQGHIGIEVFNAGCWVEIQKGHSVVHWDGLMRRGPLLWGLATDDSHWRYPDSGYGWIMLRAETLDETSVLAALRQGHFYASSGPEIHDIQIEGDQVFVRCSPARSVYALGQYYHCSMSVNAWDNLGSAETLGDIIARSASLPLVTEATFKLKPLQEYVRVEVVDAFGRSAWSNPYDLRKSIT